MKINTYFPYFNVSQRRGILLLFFLVFILQILIIFSDQFFTTQQQTVAVDSLLVKQFDSLQQLADKQQQPKIYPFNPNYLTDYKGYYLGMTVEQIDKVLAFRKTGKYFQDKKHFQRISGISDSLYQKLEPYINIPVFKRYENSGAKFAKKSSTTDINKATELDLQTISGIGKVLSARIIKYRNAIGGFTDQTQLNKVYGLEPEVVQRVWKHFSIQAAYLPKENFPQQKIPVNTAKAVDFQRVNGIGKKLSIRIEKYRDKIGGFTIPEQLNDVYGLQPDVVQRFWKYFKIENPNQNILKIDLNESNIKELSKNPYISYQLSKKIVSYRTLHGAFTNFDTLLKVEGFPKEKYKQICLYLKL